jgi:hypothetical protein
MSSVFSIQHSSSIIKEAYQIASEMLLSLDLIERIEDLNKLTYTSDSPILLAVRTRSAQQLIEAKRIQPITVKNWWHKSTAVIATTFSNDRSIYINDRAIQHCTLNDYIKNAAHEFGHIPLGYSHGTNFPPGSWRGWMLGDHEDKTMSVNHTLEKLILQLAIEKGLTKQ